MVSSSRLRVAGGVAVLALLIVGIVSHAGNSKATPKPVAAGEVACANLIYGNGKTSVCFSKQFLNAAEKDANIKTSSDFVKVKLESKELFKYPFAVMTGDGNFALTSAQRKNMRAYLESGGFIVSSASCSSSTWNKSMKAEIKRVFPKVKPKKIGASHPIFHMVYDISSSKYKSSNSKLPSLYGMEIDGKIVLVHSPDGLNDTNAKDSPSNCCCCGGNEVKSARKINVNLLAYALVY